MLRLVEAGLFLLPFVLALAWWFAGSHASRSVVWSSYAALVLVGGGLIYYGLERALPRDVAYVPARIVDGVIVEGHGRP